MIGASNDAGCTLIRSLRCSIGFPGAIAAFYSSRKNNTALYGRRFRALRDFDPAYVSSGSTASNDQGGSSGYVGSTLKS
jgi:hypothetical protein